jgi:hypothetical protein
MGKILLLTLVSVQISLGGFERTEVGARAMAFGNAYIGLADDVWAIYHNVGGIACLEKWQTSVFYSPQPYGLSELSLAAIAGVVPTKFGVLGLAVRKYGFELYHEFSGTLSYAKTVSGVNFGFNINYHTVVIKSYGSAATIGLDVGILIPVLDRLRWGASIKNINSPTIGSSKEKLPQAFSTGVAYLPLENLILLLDFRKDISFDPSSRVGFEYKIVEAVALRGGVSDEPSQFSGGIGIKYSLFSFDYAFSTHQDLGWTHAFSITIR